MKTDASSSIKPCFCWQKNNLAAFPACAQSTVLMPLPLGIAWTVWIGTVTHALIHRALTTCLWQDRQGQVRQGQS